MANFWESDPIVEQAPGAAPAPPAAAPVPPVAAAAAPPISAPSFVITPATPAAQPLNAPAAAASPAPAKSFWENDPIVEAAPAAAPAPPRSALGDLGHQLGLVARTGAHIVAGIPAVLSDAVTGPINAGLDAVAGQGNGFRFQRAGAALNNVMDAAGVAKPENAAERVVQDVTTGMGSAATGVGLGAVLAKSAGPISRAAGLLLEAAPGTQIVSGATSGGAAGLTREGGGGEGAQLAAGVAGALLPSVAPFAAGAAGRSILRGGEAGRQQVVDNVQAFQDAAGVSPTLGQATGSRGIQALETGLTNVVGGSGIMVRQGERQAQALADSVKNLTDALAPNATGADAGEAISRGVNTFRDGMRTTQARLYGALDQHIPPSTPIQVGNTEFALKELIADIPGAPNISEFFKNAKIQGIDRALQADLQQAANGAALPYEAIKKLRTLVGNEVATNNLVSDVPRASWRKLYSALSDDLGEAAKQTGPAAEQAWRRANAFTRLSMERMEQLETIVNRDAPEKIFKAATTGLAEGGTMINRLMKSLPQDNRREVTAAVLQRLGRAKPGMQNEMGDAFSSETFLTNLASMSPAARKALFNSSGFPGLSDKINQMGRMAAVRRDGAKVFSNPSGTARQGALMSWMGALIGGFGSGSPALIAGALGAPLLGNAGARFVTSPAVVDFAARKTALPGAAIPATMAAVARGTGDNGQQKPLNRLQAGMQARKIGGTVQAVPGGFAVVPPVQKYADGGLVAPVVPAAAVATPTPDERAHDAATSPNNGRPEPTPGQIDAGNYKKGHVRVAGLDLSIENPEGATRRGTDPNGKPWEVVLTTHYGYMKNSTATDGEQLDVFLKPGTPENFRGPVFVIDQLDPATGKLDEHKTILGAKDEAEAEAIYRSNYDKDWKGFGGITRLPMAAFKAWAKAGSKKEPLSDIEGAGAAG